MYIQKHEFDSAPLMTSPSRSIEFTSFEKSSAQKGFTLIELLVVMAIVSFLTTAILAGLNDMRAKGRNAAKNTHVLQYINALDLYRNDHIGTYPVTGATPVCFGYPTGEPCYGGVATGNDTIRTAITPYLAGEPAHRAPLLISGLDFKGVLYECDGQGTSVCASYKLTWVLERDVTKCPASAVPSFTLGGNRVCTYTTN